MNTDSPVKDNPLVSLTKQLRGKGITEIAIIDDAYDAPNKKTIQQVNRLLFLGEVGKDKKAIEEWHKHAITDTVPEDFEDIVDIDDVSISKLWALPPDQGTLAQLSKRYLFNDLFSKRDELKTLVEFVSGELMFKPKVLGGDPNIDDLGGCKLIFVDYFLNVDGTDLAAVQQSVDITNELYKKYKPLIVLMSSKEVTPEMQEDFKKRSDLIGGMFYFISKRDMDDKIKLFLKFDAIVKTLPLRFEFQELIIALQDKIDKVATDFLVEIKKLNVEDYAYIQRLSLQDDGQPLGDYILWLYSSYFGHLLFEKTPEVKKEQHNLNNLHFQELPLYQEIPSKTVAEIYGSALFMEADDISKHPLTFGDDENILLHLGDICIDNNYNVLMVATAQCDLAFSPLNPKRKFREDQSVVFVPGKLTTLSQPIGSSDIVTDLIRFENKEYRIRWDVKRVVTCQYGSVFDWLSNCGYKRKYRLRLPYALHVQHALTHNLSRIGLPVSPPLSSLVKATVYYKLYTPTGDSEIKSLFETETDVIVTILRSDKRIDRRARFTDKFITKLRAAIAEAAVKMKEMARPGCDGNKTRKINQYYDNLVKIVNDISVLQELGDVDLSEKQMQKLPSKIQISKNIGESKDAKIDESILINLDFEAND